MKRHYVQTSSKETGVFLDNPSPTEHRHKKNGTHGNSQSPQVPLCDCPDGSSKTAFQCFALPVYTVMMKLLCSYCENPMEKQIQCGDRLAILSCKEVDHLAWAERDAKACLGQNQHVHRAHYKGDKLFKETKLLTQYVVVPRSSGEMDRFGWSVAKPTFMSAALITFDSTEGIWVIPVVHENKCMRKYIPVRDLKLSLTEEKKPLVDAFEARLAEGFYKAEEEAHNASQLRYHTQSRE